MDGSVKCSRGNSLVLGEQVIRKLVKIADAADHGSSSHKMIAILQQGFQQFAVFGVAFDKQVIGMRIIRLFHPAILTEIIQTNNVVPGGESCFNKIPTYEAGCTRNQDPQRGYPPVLISSIVASWDSTSAPVRRHRPQTSMTVFFRSKRRLRYRECGAPRMMTSALWIASSRGTREESETYGSVHRTSVAYISSKFF